VVGLEQEDLELLTGLLELGLLKHLAITELQNSLIKPQRLQHQLILVVEVMVQTTTTKLLELAVLEL
jgi:hypothetical protein